MYTDGKRIETDIINDYNLDGYTRRLRDAGYTFGHPTEKVERLKKEYEEAKEAYEEAMDNIIIKED